MICCFMGQHTNQIIPYWIVAPGPIDVRKHGAISGDGQDDTAAFTAALAEAATKGTYVVANGHYNLGTFDWGNSVSHYQHRIEVTGSWTLSAKVSLPSFCSIIGGTGANDISFGIDSAFSIVPPTNGDAAIEVTGGQTHRLQNIKIQNSANGPAIYLNGQDALCAYVWIENVHARSTGSDPAFLSQRCFWLWIDGCSFSQAGSADSSMTWDDDSTFPAGPNVGYNGIITMRDCVIHTKGIKATNSGTAFGPATFDNVIYESADGDFFSLDSATNVVINRCHIADAVGTSYFLNAPNSASSNIWVTNSDTYYGSSTINPVSKEFRGLVQDNTRSAITASPTAIELNPAWTQEFEHYLPGRRNVRLENNYWLGGFSSVPGRSLAFSQDPSAWTTTNAEATITANQIAPDGAANAGLVTTGANYDEVRFGGPVALESVAVGDWLVAGVWVKSTDNSLHANGALLGFDGGSGFIINGSTHQLFVEGPEIFTDDAAWHYITKAAKVTTVGASATPNINFHAVANNAYGDTYFANPSVLHIPAGVWSDMEVINFCRSIRNLPQGAKLSDLAVLDHQRVRLGGGARLLSASASPTSGTYEAGERVFNNGPSLGEAEYWTSTVAGTQGTLVGVTADTTSGQPTITVNSASDLQLNQYITIAGITGIKKIIRINGTTITIDSNASATVDDGAVVWSPAAFVAGPPIGASFAKSISFVVTGTTVDAATGDNQVYVHIPPALNGYTINYVHAAVATAGTTGTTDVQIARTRSGSTVDVLSTKLTIDSTETGSDTAAAAAVINASNDDLATNDRLRIDVDAVSTTAPKGLVVTVEAVR